MQSTTVDSKKPCQDHTYYDRECLSCRDLNDYSSSKEATGVGSHTPGPWEYSHDLDGDYVIFAANAKIVAITNADSDEEARNARLIAASPELLSCVKEILNDPNSAAHTSDGSFTRAIEAIRKAEGR